MYRLRYDFGEEMRVADRPLLMVGPLRAERTEETPEEPTCERRGKHQCTIAISSLDGKSNGVSHVDVLVKGSADKQNTEVHSSPLSSSGSDGRSFANCVNRIVKELMIKVDRLENILSGLHVHHSIRR
ncbi:hypothetical protein KIN20_007792 [Parelaphostrongylus tenuis]|uniref:Uncharacterized protein n=1 Tax=Parelaphostrongylus tenuis TaxID=148309 RepID=A0AAD5M8K6_PARTN|nr:hypothetical protein KIN20_007792 [Parelaphostrongylus tenuis]